MAASPSKRAPLASLPNKKSARLRVSSDRQDISDEDLDKFEEDLRMAKGYHKRVLSENRDSEGDEDELLAKKARVHIDSSNEQTDVSADIPASSFLQRREASSRDSPRLRSVPFDPNQSLQSQQLDLLSLSSSHLPMVSHLSLGSNLNQQVQSLDPPSSSSLHSRTASTSSRATSTSETSPQGVHFISNARESSESSELDAFQDTTLREGGQSDSSQNTIWTDGELNASQSTVVTEPEGGFYFPVVAATTGTTRFLSRAEVEKQEKIRELTYKLRVKLIYAKYKVDTHQVHIPFNELEIRYVAPPKIGKSWIKSREITDFAIAKWDRDRIMLETRKLANTRLPIAPKGLQSELRDFSFKPPTPEKANAPLRPMSPRSRLHDLGFDTESSSDSEDELLPRKAAPYNYWASRGNPAKKFDPDVDACDGLLSLSRGTD